MSWLGGDFTEELSDPIQAHFAGIELTCKVPGLEYCASVPDYLIKATRILKTEPFRVIFIEKDWGKTRRAAILNAGTNRESIEKCIIQAVNRPSMLDFNNGHALDLLKADRDIIELDTKWPEIPGPFEPFDKVNMYTVKKSKIYRLMTREYKIGVSRRDFESNFIIYFWRHDGKIKRKYEVGNTTASVHDFIVEAIQDKDFFWWKSKK